MEKNKKLFMLSKILPIAAIALLLSSCTQSLNSRLSKDDRGNNHYHGSYKIGQSYQKKGVEYVPQKFLHYKQEGLASWYGRKDGFHGKKTANGEKYNSNMLTAAHPTLPMPSLVRVTNIKNHKSLIVMINDRGPFSKKRIIDVSERSAEILGFKRQGVANVRIEYLPDETKGLLDKLTLRPKEGSRTKKKVKDPTCSVNCYIKLVNIKHRCHSF